MPAQSRQSQSGPDAILPSGVRRAREAMRAEPEREFAPADLAAIAGLSVRTLQRQFRSFLGKSPLAALRDIRFECARRELLRGSPRQTVMDIALRYGFGHLGRFSVEYRRRYGEKPSQTWQRQAIFTAEQPIRTEILAFTQDRPAVALVPIETGGQDPAIAQGIAEELATALMRAGIAVTNKLESARYRLLGTFRGDGARARLIFRLMQVETGRHIWAHRHDGRAGTCPLDERLATTIAAALQPSLRATEIERALNVPDVELTAYDLTLRALPHALALDANGHTRALDLLERATDLDPSYALAIALAAWCHAQRVVYQFTDNPAEEREKTLSLARRAMSIGGDATVLAVIGNALTSAQDIQTAQLVVRKALALDGGSAWAWSRSGWIDVFLGEAESAIERFAIALDLAPHDPLAFNSFVGLGCAHFHAGRYRDAAHWFERAINERPAAVWVHRALCPAYALDGCKPEAERSLAALRRVYPGVTALQIATAIPVPQTFRERVADGLESVGLPP